MPRSAAATAMASKAKAGAITQEASLTMVKNLVRTAIASIAYTRGLFPEKCFEKATLRGAGSSQDDRVTVRLLRPHRVDDGAAVLYQWIEEGVFDALKRRYLEELVFSITTPDGEHLESYHFRTQCDEDGSGTFSGLGLEHAVGGASGSHTAGRALLHTRSDLKAATVRLIRTLVTLTDTFEELPGERMLSVQLFYNDTAPDSYEPLFFRRAVEGDPGDRDATDRIAPVRCGRVSTNHHEVVVAVRASPAALGEAEAPAPPPPPPAQMPTLGAAGPRGVLAATTPPPRGRARTKGSASRARSSSAPRKGASAMLRAAAAAQLERQVLARLADGTAVSGVKLVEHLGRASGTVHSLLQRLVRRGAVVARKTKGARGTSALVYSVPGGAAADDAACSYEAFSRLVLSSRSTEPGALADAAGVSVPAATAMLARMAADGYLEAARGGGYEVARGDETAGDDDDDDDDDETGDDSDMSSVIAPTQLISQVEEPEVSNGSAAFASDVPTQDTGRHESVEDGVARFMNALNLSGGGGGGGDGGGSSMKRRRSEVEDDSSDDDSTDAGEAAPASHKRRRSTVSEPIHQAGENDDSEEEI